MSMICDSGKFLEISTRNVIERSKKVEFFLPIFKFGKTNSSTLNTIMQNFRSFGAQIKKLLDSQNREWFVNQAVLGRVGLKA